MNKLPIVIMAVLGGIYFCLVPLILFLTGKITEHTILWLMPVAIFPLFLLAIISRFKEDQKIEYGEVSLYPKACRNLGTCLLVLAFLGVGRILFIVIVAAMLSGRVTINPIIIGIIGGVSAVYFALAFPAKAQKGIIAVAVISIIIAVLGIFGGLFDAFVFKSMNPGMYAATGALFVWLITSATKCLVLKAGSEEAMAEFRNQRSGRSSAPAAVSPNLVQPPAAEPQTRVVFCPHCNQKYSLEDDMTGEQIQCQNCSGTFAV